MSVPKVVTDLVMAFLILLMTYALSSEGLWGAALMFFNVVFGGLIAFNFYEPLARLIDSTGIGWGFSDTLSLLSIFCVSVMLLRMTTETLAPAMVRFPVPVYHAGRVFFALATSLVTMAILVLAFHTAPVHKKIFGAIDYKYKPPFGIGLDHQWLGFFQYTTGMIFARYGSGTRDPYSEYGRSGNQRVPVRVFDPRATWLLNHQEARPYGQAPILTEESGSADASASGGSGSSAATAGGQRGRPGTKGASGSGSPAF
ncbi:MAG TPA: hypothetical protein VN648_21110 [Candidatus Methylomirabilis sp.]|nr:hypothetical protein [Candidatus Methylomirabilis sp.]